MRSIRNAAVAGATALALTMGGTAFAADAPLKDVPTEATGNASSKLSQDYEGDKAIYGVDAFGSETIAEKPAWFEAWMGFTIAGIVLAVLTNLIAPAYNWAVYNGYLQ
ncbi:MAG: hypothetical protein SPI77_02585 [Corynebacterium sp.]|nr:hypothetical protein [Corynebacterium sp.]